MSTHVNQGEEVEASDRELVGLFVAQCFLPDRRRTGGALQPEDEPGGRVARSVLGVWTLTLETELQPSCRVPPADPPTRPHTERSFPGVCVCQRRCLWTEVPAPLLLHHTQKRVCLSPCSGFSVSPVDVRRFTVTSERGRRGEAAPPSGGARN
ncbi:hypothetical protein GBF38_009560 [Nibea albiflora]|uniref:Uncharacterized protein n=1 Tax=Nibea albiflora TaxID=240163 RepID=A0ACB7F7J7_NIBAL|nr:hypothetical protein GBF38_009560 [Nibea albiflora]